VRHSPLAGLRVIELARILAGPWAGQTLSDLGAEVIKIEAPEGDDTRRWGPPFVPLSDGSAGDAAYFHSCNRGKASVIADLRTVEGRRVVTTLASKADVLIENFKVGDLMRYGLDFDTLKATNPRLIYCSITGFGQSGPYAHRAGYDAMIQGLSGIMDLTGEAAGEPQKVGVAIADIVSSLYAVIGIQAALIQREQTGRGQHIDVALMDAMLGVLANQNLNYLVTGTSPTRMGNAHPNIVPYQSFDVCNGRVMLAVGNDVQFARLCHVIGKPELGVDPRFSTNQERVNHREAIVTELELAFSTWNRDDLLYALEKAAIPSGPINTLAEAFADPQVAFRQLRQDASAPWAAGGCVPSVRTPLIFSEAKLREPVAAPRLGADTTDVVKSFESLRRSHNVGGNS
jgi:crotonobetainyl-CoA:carnitine CoA-transferase CaiB-like acyl-CoA transferase